MMEQDLVAAPVYGPELPPADPKVYFRVSQPCETSLCFELVKVGRDTYVCMDLNYWILGVPLCDLIDVRLHSLNGRIRTFLAPDSNLNDMWRHRGKTNEMMISCLSHTYDSFEKILVFIRSNRSENLKNQEFVEQIKTLGKKVASDLVCIYPGLLLMQERITAARKEATKLRAHGVDVDHIRDCFAGILLEIFHKNSVAVPLSTQVHSNIMVPSQVIIDLVLVDRTMRFFEGFDRIGTMTPGQYLGYVLEYGGFGLLRETASVLAACYERIISDTTATLREGYTRLAVGDVVDEQIMNVIQIPGVAKKTFAQKIEVLAGYGGSEPLRSRARSTLLWGHFSFLMYHKLNQLTKIQALKDTPLGVSMDGASMGGRKIQQVLLRDDLYIPGVFMTFPLPLFIIKSYSEKDMQRYLTHIGAVMVARNAIDDYFRTCLVSAAVRQRIGFLYSAIELGVERGINLGIDKGSVERKFWTWMMRNGYKINVVFDSPHEENRQSIYIGERVLPRDFGRFLKMRSTCGGEFASRMGQFFNEFMNLQDDQILDVIDGARGELFLSLPGAEGETVAEKCLHQVRRMRGEISTFSSTKRFLKYAYAASFVLDNWALLKIVVTALLQKSRPHYFSLQATPTIDFRPREQFARMQFKSGDLNRMRNKLDKMHQKQKEKREQLLKENVVEGYHEDSENDEADEADLRGAEGAGGAGSGTAATLEQDVPKGQFAEVARPGAFLDGNLRRVRQAAKQPQASKKPAKKDSDDDMDDEKADHSLLGVLCTMLNDQSARIRVEVYFKMVKPRLWYHAVGICQAWNNLLARKWFFNEGPGLLRQTAAAFHSQVTPWLSSKVQVHGAGPHIASLAGGVAEDALRQIIDVHSARMCLWHRVRMYAEYQCPHICLKSLEIAAENYNMGPLVKWILGNTYDFLALHGYDVSNGLNEVSYNGDILSDPSTEMPGLVGPGGVHGIVGQGFTHFDPRGLRAPADYERNLFMRIKEVAQAETEQAKSVMKFLFGEQEFYIVAEFMKLLEGNRLREARNFATVWNKSMPLGTRDIEAKFGDLSVAAKRAHNAGAVVDQLPLHLAERVIPTGFEFLKPQWLEKQPDRTREVGARNTFSPLDQREPLSLAGADTEEELKHMMYGADRSFEKQTVDLVSLTDFDTWWDLKSKDRTRDPVQEFRDWAKERPRVTDTEIRSEMSTAMHIDAEQHGLTAEQVKNIAETPQNVGDAKHILNAEFVIDEHFEFLLRDTRAARDRWEKGRVLCVLLYGILKKCKDEGRPLLLEVVKGPDVHHLHSLEVIPGLRMVTGVVCDEADDERDKIMTDETKSDLRKALDQIADLNRQDGAKIPGAEGPSEADLLNSHGVFAGAEAQEEKRYDPEQDLLNYVPLQFPTEREAWMYPMPTCEKATKSKLKGLVLLPFGIQHMKNDNFDSITILESTRFGCMSSKVFTYIKKSSNSLQILECAEKMGYFLSKTTWTPGYTTSKRADVGAIITFLVQESPILLECLRGDDFVPHVDWNNTTYVRAPSGCFTTDANGKIISYKPMDDDLDGLFMDADAGTGFAGGPARADEFDLDSEVDLPSRLLEEFFAEGEHMADPKDLNKENKKERLLPADDELDDGHEGSLMGSFFMGGKSDKKTTDGKGSSTLKTATSTLNTTSSADMSPRAKIDLKTNDDDPGSLTHLHKCMNLDDITLTLKQRTELFYIFFKGMKEGEKTLLKNDFYGISMVKPGKKREAVPAPVSTISKTAAEFEAALRKTEVQYASLGVARAQNDLKEQKQQKAMKKAPTAKAAFDSEQKLLGAPQKEEGLHCMEVDGDSDDSDATTLSGLKIDNLDDFVGDLDGDGEGADAALADVEMQIRQQYSTEKGKKTLTQSRLMFYRDDLDLVREQAKVHGKRFALRCMDPKCKAGSKEVGHCKFQWVHNNGPTLFYGPDEACKMSKACGPMSHAIRSTKKNALQCYCGFWRARQCWATKDYKTLINKKATFNCAVYQARDALMKLHPDHQGCNWSKTKISCFSKAQTFTARQKVDQDGELI
ncbi:unnamed protein product [Amoebophrya sp. A25]|nr:unnamed protein product [Amoebophrya sp. A25]|eukprot:GSA25T00027654001.1